ncbi:MAG: hypothetical protein QF886_26275, partial [Planctomycetota bacterium]|nr:hypothetical protein [Planctomycetota bacterium]
IFSPVGNYWKIAVLYTGSLLICFPCLQVFTQFIGYRFGLAQMLSLALVISGVAGLFSFGFIPIIWFIDFSTEAGTTAALSPRWLSTFLLAVSLVMGVIHMLRLLIGSEQAKGFFPMLISFWLALLAFITYRMVYFLDLV